MGWSEYLVPRLTFLVMAIVLGLVIRRNSPPPAPAPKNIPVKGFVTGKSAVSGGTDQTLIPIFAGPSIVMIPIFFSEPDRYFLEIDRKSVRVSKAIWDSCGLGDYYEEHP